jgi:hypothetical protein
MQQIVSKGQLLPDEVIIEVGAAAIAAAAAVPALLGFAYTPPDNAANAALAGLLETLATMADLCSNTPAYTPAASSPPGPSNRVPQCSCRVRCSVSGVKPWC